MESREMTDEIMEIHVESIWSLRGERTTMNSIRKSNTLERSKHSKAGAKQDAKQRRAGAKDAKRRMQTNRSIATMAKEHVTRRDRIEFEFEIEKRKESNEFQIERAEPTATEKDPVGIESQRSIEGDVLELTVGRREDEVGIRSWELDTDERKNGQAHQTGLKQDRQQAKASIVVPILKMYPFMSPFMDTLSIYGYPIVILWVYYQEPQVSR